MSKNKQALVSVVVLSWNTLEDTKNCIESIRLLKYENKEIIVVDNGSNDGSKDYLKIQKDIKYIDLPQNTGFTGGQIEAFNVAKGKYVALINSDAVVANDWLSKLIDVLEKDEKIGAVGGKSYTWRNNEKPYNTNNQFYSYQVIDVKRGYARTLMAGSENTIVDSISGAGVIIRRVAINKVGYFDNKFFAYYEETDLFARMQRAGYKIVYVPSAHIWHKIAASSSDSSYFYYYQMHRNRFLFAMKNFDTSYEIKFLWFYFVDGLKASVRYIKNKKDLDNKARFKALLWNFSRLPFVLIQRYKIKKLGETYTKHLLNHAPSNDITVIIPSYNYSQFLDKAIESVVSQSLKPKRIIIIDDGSTDNSLEIANKYQKKGVEIISKQNEGVIATKNLGIKLSETTWTVFVDADDILDKKYLEKLYMLASRKHCDVVYTDMEYIGAKTGIHKSGSFSYSRLLSGNFIHNSALISTTYLEQVGGYKSEMKDGYEDWELYISIAEVGAKFGYYPKPIFYYRQHSKDKSRNNEAKDRSQRILKTVKSLHISSYRYYSHSFRKFEVIIKRLAENPLLIFVAILVLPLCLLAAIKAFFVTFFARLSYRTRNYLHNRDVKKNNEDDELWLKD